MSSDATNPAAHDVGSAGVGGEAEMLREAAGRLFADVLTPASRAAAAEGRWPDEVWSAVEELGLPAAMLPEAAGGFGVPLGDALSLLSVAGEHALPLPLADTMLAGSWLARAGLEVPTGPIALAPAAEVKVDADGRVSGRAWDVPWARAAGSIVLLGGDPDAPRVLRLSANAVAIEPGLNIAGEPCDSVRFDGAVAEAAPAPFTAAEWRATGAATRAILMAGALKAVSALTVGYAGERKQFGRAIGKYQAVQQSLATLAGQAASAQAAAGLAADAVEAGGPGLVPAVATAKIRCGEAAGEGAAIAHQVHGAIGFTQEYRLHEYTRRLWAWRDEYGREAEWAAVLGRHLVASGPDGLWPALTAI